jgi:DNA-binding XRE family transcriptional regulator
LCPKKTQSKKGGGNMNANELRSVMALHGDTYKDLADFLEISETSFTNKINEKGTEFKYREIVKIKNKYNLSAEQVDSIFFNKSVS